MQVAKWGNSLAVRLPKALVEKLPSSLKLLCNTGRNVGQIGRAHV